MFLPRFMLISALLFNSPLFAYQVDKGLIYDDNKKEIRLNGVNISGFETHDGVIHGLWQRQWQDLIQAILTAGFTAVRVPFCPDTLSSKMPSTIDYQLNPDLKGLTRLQLFDKILNEFNNKGLYILLDHHRPTCANISELWYTDEYSEQQWLNDLEFVAKRYADLPFFLGIDLKNEPHGIATWGTGNIQTDWNTAAEKAAKVVLAANPYLLVFVEGIGENPVCSDNTGHGWGGNFEPMTCHPLNIPLNKLVISPHVYGPDVFAQSYFTEANFPANMAAIWDKHFGFLLAQGYAVVLGEFGGRYGNGGNSQDRIWQDALVDYLIQKGMVNFFYWTFNPNSSDTGGILQDDWVTFWPNKLNLINRLASAKAIPAQKNPVVATDSDTVTDKPADTALPAISACDVDYQIKSQWDNGFVVEISLHNPNTHPINGWQLAWDFASDVQFVNQWNADLSQTNRHVMATAVDWNQTLYPNETITLGFQAEGRVADIPAQFQLNNKVCQLKSADNPRTVISQLPENHEKSADYHAGFATAVALCRQNPETCGIKNNRANYQPFTGALFVPLVGLTAEQTSRSPLWTVVLQQIQPQQCVSNKGLLFELQTVIPLFSFEQ